MPKLIWSSPLDLAKLPKQGFNQFWRLIFYSLSLPLRQERATKTVLITVATQVTKPMTKSTVIRTPFSSIISKRNYTRVLLAKLGKQAIACDETNRLNYGHFLEMIIPCCLYGVNTVGWSGVQFPWSIFHSPARIPPIRSMICWFFRCSICFWTALGFIWSSRQSSFLEIFGFFLISSRIFNVVSDHFF